MLLDLRTIIKKFNAKIQTVLSLIINLTNYSLKNIKKILMI